MRQAERQDDEPDLKPRYESVQRAQQSGLEQKDRKVEHQDISFISIKYSARAILNNYVLVKFEENFDPPSTFLKKPLLNHTRNVRIETACDMHSEFTCALVTTMQQS